MLSNSLSIRSPRIKTGGDRAVAYSLAMMGKKVTVSRHRFERMLFSSTDSFTVISFGKTVATVATREILLLEDKAKYGFRKKKILHLQMLAPKCWNKKIS